MKIAICDDIVEYRLSVKCYTEEYFKTHHINCEVDEYNSGHALANANIDYDIIFLDIELGDSNGIDIAKYIKSQFSNSLIIVITSYRQYLDEAMDLNVLRYIDKPITQNRIFSALDKAMSQIHETIITVHTKDNQIIRLKVSDIVYAEAKLKKVTIYTKNSSFIIRESLKSLKELLVASCFAIPHNSYILNLNFIRKFKRDEIKLAVPYENESISISTRKQAEFKRKFLDFIGEDYKND